jgi:hypothetical protein
MADLPIRETVEFCAQRQWHPCSAWSWSNPTSRRPFQQFILNPDLIFLLLRNVIALSLQPTFNWAHLILPLKTLSQYLTSWSRNNSKVFQKFAFNRKGQLCLQLSTAIHSSSDPESREYIRRDIPRWPCGTLFGRYSSLATQATDFSFFFRYILPYSCTGFILSCRRKCASCSSSSSELQRSFRGPQTIYGLRSILIMP